MNATTTESKLTKKQVRTFGPVALPPTSWAKERTITAKVRYDDEFGNGHNTFAITADIQENGIWAGGGCCHEEVAAAFPELAPLIKFHLCSSDGPLHYVANAAYHALEHGPTHAWIYYSGQHDPLCMEDKKERLLTYAKTDKAKMAEGKPGYRVQWDEKTVKVRNLDHARSSAIWPDATDEELTAPGLKERLEARLPALMAEFRAAVESLGFTW